MSDKLQRYVCQYFAETITANISKFNYSSDEDEDEGPASNAKGTGKLPAAFITAHALIKQLNRSVPSLLLNVIPQLEEELSAEKPEYRKLATETLGAMLGEKIGQGDLARKYPATWKAWLSRSKDKVVGVRIAMVESLKKIWTEHSELGADIEGAVSRIMADGDEKVRIAACRVFLELDYETACHHVSTNILKELGERCQDRKVSPFHHSSNAMI
jgi:sister-chromatid-cohesion protein PDS5